MSCGLTSATRPMIAGMATSIYDICPSWPAPPHVARMTREASGKRQKSGGRPVSRTFQITGEPDRLAATCPFFRVARELVGEPIEELDHPGAPLSKCRSGRDDVTGTAEARPLKGR